ncbi:MAG TPA: carboxymuconolactone decarboxylase family protein [Burkholderiales bacterium]|nr:carboxymuconolactone decarboxylase family protein [Burkholderiales bacterium]
MSTTRFSPLDDRSMTPEQKRVAAAIQSGPRQGLRGPFNALLRSPDLADRVQKVGEYIRFRSSIAARLNELAILIVARKWTAQFEWYAHHQFAMKAGLDPAVAAAIAEGRRPDAMRDDEKVVYAFCTELLDTAQLSDSTYAATVGLVGEQGVIDLIGALGYYSMVSMILNTDRYPLPEGVEPPLKTLAR